jgi:hypothetical protein
MSKSVEFVFSVYRQLRVFYPALSVSQFCVQYLNVNRNYLFVYRRQLRVVTPRVLTQLSQRLSQLLKHLCQLPRQCRTKRYVSAHASDVVRLIAQTNSYITRSR